MIASDGLAWMDRAACKGLTSLFFPVRGEPTGEARRVCAGCPVRTECLDYAISTAQKVGVWGGLSERARRKLRRDRIDSGSVWQPMVCGHCCDSFTWQVRRGTVPKYCGDRCRQLAANVRQNEYNARIRSERAAS